MILFVIIIFLELNQYRNGLHSKTFFGMNIDKRKNDLDNLFISSDDDSHDNNEKDLKKIKLKILKIKFLMILKIL